MVSIRSIRPAPGRQSPHGLFDVLHQHREELVRRELPLFVEPLLRDPFSFGRDGDGRRSSDQPVEARGVSRIDGRHRVEDVEVHVEDLGDGLDAAFNSDAASHRDRAGQVVLHVDALDDLGRVNGKAGHGGARWYLAFGGQLWSQRCLSRKLLRSTATSLKR